MSTLNRAVPNWRERTGNSLFGVVTAVRRFFPGEDHEAFQMSEDLLDSGLQFVFDHCGRRTQTHVENPFHG